MLPAGVALSAFTVSASLRMPLAGEYGSAGVAR